MDSILARIGKRWNAFARLFPIMSEKVLVFVVTMAVLGAAYGLWSAWRALVT